MEKFELFLGSYFRKFKIAKAYVKDAGDGQPGFMEAAKNLGGMQLFPGKQEVLPIVNDGRWRFPPAPNDRAIRPVLEAPLGIRRDPNSGVTVILMSPPDECFAMSMSQQEADLGAFYLSLFGRDVKQGQTLTAHVRLVFGKNINDSQAIQKYQEYLTDRSSANTGTISWKDLAGRMIQGAFVRLDGESLVIRKDGKEFNIPFSKLSPASVAQAKSLGAHSPPATTPTTPTATSGQATTPTTPSTAPTTPATTQTGPLKPVPLAGKTPPPVVEPKLLDCQNEKPWRPTPYLMNGEEFPFDADGNLLLLKGSNADKGVLKLSGTTGKPLWSTPAGRLGQIKRNPHFKATGSCMYLVGQTAAEHTMVSDPASPMADLALACISYKDGTVSWTQTYDAPQKGEESGYKLLTDRAGNLVIVVDSKMPPSPVANPQDREAKTASNTARAQMPPTMRYHLTTMHHPPMAPYAWKSTWIPNTRRTSA